MEPDVLVVGAGPAGAAVSILLVRHGYRVLLVDRATFPRDKPCAEYLSPACTPILALLGVIETILAAAPQRLQGMRITDARGCSCWGRFVHQGTPLHGLALPRLVFDHVLVQQARREGVTVRTGFWVRRPVVEGQDVRGVYGQEGQQATTIRAKVVIAADGLHSILARRLGLIRRVYWLQHVALVTHYTDVAYPQPWGEMFLTPSGYIGLAPVGTNLMNVSVVVHSDWLRTGVRCEEAVTQALQAHPELRQRFARAKRVKQIRAIGPMAQRTVWPQHGGILFIGDAAGFFDPFTGQGIYLALHSAELAAAIVHRALRTGDLSAHALQHYCRVHRQAFHSKYRFSELIQLGIRMPWLAHRIIRRLAQCPALADTVVSVAGDIVAPQALLSWQVARQLLV